MLSVSFYLVYLWTWGKRKSPTEGSNRDIEASVRRALRLIDRLFGELQLILQKNKRSKKMAERTSWHRQTARRWLFTQLIPDSYDQGSELMGMRIPKDREPLALRIFSVFNSFKLHLNAFNSIVRVHLLIFAGQNWNSVSVPPTQMASCYTPPMNHRRLTS